MTEMNDLVLGLDFHSAISQNIIDLKAIASPSYCLVPYKEVIYLFQRESRDHKHSMMDS